MSTYDGPDRCPRCEGMCTEPGSEEYDYTVHMYNPFSGEPCHACNGTGKAAESNAPARTPVSAATGGRTVGLERHRRAEMSYPTFLNSVEHAVRNEREAQDAKWGEQNHPNGTGLHYLKAEADEARHICQYAFDHERGTWRHILAEEVAEAFAEKDPAALRTELIQVAAVAQAWLEAIDRRET